MSPYSFFLSLFPSTVQLLQGEGLPETPPGPVHHQRNASRWGLQRAPVPGERSLRPPGPPRPPLPPPEHQKLPHPALRRWGLYRHWVALAARSAAADREVSLPLLRRPRGRTLRQHQQGEGGRRAVDWSRRRWGEKEEVVGERTAWTVGGTGEFGTADQLQPSADGVDAPVELIVSKDDRMMQVCSDVTFQHRDDDVCDLGWRPTGLCWSWTQDLIVSPSFKDLPNGYFLLSVNLRTVIFFSFFHSTPLTHSQHLRLAQWFK